VGALIRTPDRSEYGVFICVVYDSIASFTVVVVARIHSFSHIDARRRDGTPTVARVSICPVSPLPT